jgi:hypothetical protein
LKDVSNTELQKMSPKQRRLNIVMRDLRAAVNAGAVASHVPCIAATQKSIMQLGDDGNEYRKVPNLALTRYFIMAPVMHILLTQWAPLLAAADRSGRGPNQFKEYGHNAGLLLVAAAVEPAFARMNQLCVYGQSSAHHVGSLRSMVSKTRDAIRELYGLGSDEQAGGETDAAAAAADDDDVAAVTADDDDDVAAVTAADNEDDAVAAADNDDDDGGSTGGGGGGNSSSVDVFSGPAFSLFQRYSTLKENGGALVVVGQNVMLYVPGDAQLQELRAVKNNGGPPSSKAGPLRHNRLERIVNWAKTTALIIVKNMLAELGRRFPPDAVMDTLAVADVSYWRAIRGSGEDHTHLLSAADVIASSFSTARGGSLFNLALLQSQAPAFHEVVLNFGLGTRDLTSNAPAEQQPEKASAGDGRSAEQDSDDDTIEAAIAAATRDIPLTPTDHLWREVFCVPRAKLECSEWLKFVNMSYAVVLGTNDNERTHSRIKLLRTALRSTMAVDHLTPMLRFILHPGKIEPKRAFAKWVVGSRERVKDGEPDKKKQKT